MNYDPALFIIVVNTWASCTFQAPMLMFVMLMVYLVNVSSICPLYTYRHGLATTTTMPDEKNMPWQFSYENISFFNVKSYNDLVVGVDGLLKTMKLWIVMSIVPPDSFGTYILPYPLRSAMYLENTESI